MRMAARLIKLETAFQSMRKRNPYKAALEEDIKDWIINDPMAPEILSKEYAYCVSKGYPTMGSDTFDFYDQLQDPVFEEMGAEHLAAFDNYLRSRSI